MKYLSTLCLFLLFAYSASAQQVTITAKQAKDNIGKKVVLTDTVKGYKVVNDSLTILSLGEGHPGQQVDIVIKVKGSNWKSSEIVGNLILVNGTVILYKQKLEIVVSDPKMLYVRKMIRRLAHKK